MYKPMNHNGNKQQQATTMRHELVNELNMSHQFARTFTSGQINISYVHHTFEGYEDRV